MRYSWFVNYLCLVVKISFPWGFSDNDRFKTWRVNCVKICAWNGITIPPLPPSNRARPFSRWKVAFSALIELQILLTVRALIKKRTTCFSKTHLFFIFCQPLLTAKFEFYWKKKETKLWEKTCWQEILPAMTSAWTIYSFSYHWPGSSTGGALRWHRRDQGSSPV